ncbi:hypothetical protein ACP8HI_01455 [Paenibacillus sp. FA6]|uniref:hypothetical protein n=1 Tax=Paenibacillus sp. FA6 TaxID=3413029 RepID=UPI003F65E015
MLSNINRNLRLSLFSGSNFTGRQILFRHGGVAVRNLGAFQFNNELTSFRLRNSVNPSDVTLVLFSRNNFQGSIRVFRGSQNIANLANFNFNNVTSSFILVSARLSDQNIREIQRTSTPPCDILVITR